MTGGQFFIAVPLPRLQKRNETKSARASCSHTHTHTVERFTLLEGEEVNVVPVKGPLNTLFHEAEAEAAAVGFESCAVCARVRVRVRSESEIRSES